MYLNQCTAAAIYFPFKPIFIISEQAMQILFLFLVYLRLIPDSQRAGWEQGSGTGSLMTCDTCTSPPLLSSTKSRDISLIAITKRACGCPSVGGSVFGSLVLLLLQYIIIITLLSDFYSYLYISLVFFFPLFGTSHCFLFLYMHIG